MSNARAARRRSQKNKKTAHKTDIHIFFNGGWFESIKDAEYHIRQITARRSMRHPAISKRLRFQAHHVQDKSKEQTELFPSGELIHFAFSSKVTLQARNIVKGAAQGYFCEFMGAVREDMESKGLPEPPIQKPDVVLWFNTSYPELDIGNNNSLFQGICVRASLYGFGIDTLIFQPRYIIKGEDLEERPAVGFSFSPNVDDHQRHIISNVIVSYVDEMVGSHLNVQEIPAQESPDHSQASDTAQSSDNLP